MVCRSDDDVDYHGDIEQDDDHDICTRLSTRSYVILLLLLLLVVFVFIIIISYYYLLLSITIVIVTIIIIIVFTIGLTIIITNIITTFPWEVVGKNMRFLNRGCAISADLRHSPTSHSLMI